MVISDAIDELSLTNKVLFRAVPESCSAQDVAALLQQFGPLECICYEQGQGCGFAEFLFCGSAERAEEESNKLASSLQLKGRQLEVRREAPGAEGAMSEAFVPSGVSEKTLDTVIVRGHSGKAAIGIVAELAKSKATTLVIWDRQHRKDEAKVAAAVTKKVYTETFSEQGPDREVMKKAEDYFSAGMPKCALLHVGSDNLMTEAKLERPLFQVDELCRSISHNHTETIGVFNSFLIYQPWVHANRACTFILLPPSLRHEWDDDIATCTVGLRRAIRADEMRLPDGSGWTVGLQLTKDSPAVSKGLAFAALRDVVLANDEVKNHLSGKTIDVGMPNLSVWGKPRPSQSDS